MELTPAEFRAEAVAEALREFGPIGGSRVLLPRADIARDVLAEALREAGAEVEDVDRLSHDCRPAPIAMAIRTSTGCCSTARSMP